MTLRKSLVALVAMAAFSGAHAQLQSRPGGMVYDPLFDVTYIADMNYAMTSGYDADGRMSWEAAASWADRLEYGGFGDWRLGSTDNLIYDYEDPNRNELWHLWYVDLGLPIYSQPFNATPVPSPHASQNRTLFSTIVPTAWFGNVSMPPPDSPNYTFREAYLISPGFGFDSLVWFTDRPNWPEAYAVALRDGDVAAPIPEPSTYALMLSGLAALMVVARRRSATNRKVT